MSGRLLARGLLAVVILAMVALPGASAEVTGDCQVFIQGEDAAKRSSTNPADAIPIHIGDNVSYEVVVPAAAKHFRLVAVLGPYEVVIDERNYTRPAEVLVITGNTTFEGLPGGAAGVYEYRGEVTRWDGGSCEGKVLVKIIPASAFTPVLIAATVIAAGGLASIIVLIIRGYQDSREIFDIVKDYVGEAKAVASTGAGAGKKSDPPSEE